MRRRLPTRTQQVLLIAGILLAFGVPTWLTYRAEGWMREGESVLLALYAGEDHRIVQGRYILLRFPQLDALAVDSLPRAGRLAVKLDSGRVGTELRYVPAGEETRPGERILRYRTCGDHPCVGAEAFFVETGTVEAYLRAQFAEYRVLPDGRTILAGLRDADGRPIIAPP